VFKRPISAGVGPYMPLFPGIYGFEGLPTFPRENATFRNGTLMIFPKYSRKFQILCPVIVVVEKLLFEICKHRMTHFKFI
jgi:hypothetical protein